MQTTERNILIIAPPVYRPDLPNFSGRFDTFSEKYGGHVACRCPRQYDGHRYGRFTVHSVMHPDDHARASNARNVAALVSLGLRLHRERPLDAIVCYDPLTLGLAGSLLKRITGARLVVELNGHLLEAGFLGRSTLGTRARRAAFRAVIAHTLGAADGVKYLNRKLFDEYGALAPNAAAFRFPDYVPVSSFEPGPSEGDYVLFVGFPYHLKGVDVLIRAFKRVSVDLPRQRLVIVGYNPVDLDVYRVMAQSCPQIEFHQPVHYDALAAYFQGCSLFVLPSRSEAMGRVLVEAMAAGKAVVASRVGGIPEVVEDGVTGLLFESESDRDLEVKMRALLLDDARRRRMAEAGRRRAHTVFSERRYGSEFAAMVEHVLQRGAHSAAASARGVSS